MSPLTTARRPALILPLFIVASIVAGSAACGGQDKPPSVDPGVIQISGNERLTWDQVATSAFEVATFLYVVYVDGTPADVRELVCSSTQGPAGFVCSSRLPAMTQGTHTIELAAYLRGSDRLASPKSLPIRVRLGSATSGAPAAALGHDSFATIDGIRLRAAVVATGLEDPTNLVTLPDGRLLIAERAGRVRVFRDGALMPSPALTLTDATTGEGGGLLALAADSEFETTRAVYALYTTRSGLRLARFIESNNTLSSRAILLDGLPISPSLPKATIEMGPDGKLYLGLDDGGDVNSPGDLGSFSGKVLRLNRDGTTPEDQAIGTPIFATGLGRPTGMDWSQDGPTLWLAGTDVDGSDQLQAIALGPEIRRGAIGKRYALPPGVGASTFAFYASNLIPAFRGNMFIAAEGSRSLLRVRVDRSGAITETEWLLRDQFDSIRAISVAADGSLYVGTLNSLVRIVPER